MNLISFECACTRQYLSWHLWVCRILRVLLLVTVPSVLLSGSLFPARIVVLFSVRFYVVLFSACPYNAEKKYLLYKIFLRTTNYGKRAPVGALLTVVVWELYGSCMGVVTVGVLFRWSNIWFACRLKQFLLSSSLMSACWLLGNSNLFHCQFYLQCQKYVRPVLSFFLPAGPRFGQRIYLLHPVV